MRLRLNRERDKREGIIAIVWGVGCREEGSSNKVSKKSRLYLKTYD